MTEFTGIIPRQESVMLTLELMGKELGQPMSLAAQTLALQYLIERRICPVCNAQPTQWCVTYGWTSTVMRTHTARLRLTHAQLSRAAHWAIEREERDRKRVHLFLDDDEAV